MLQYEVKILNDCGGKMVSWPWGWHNKGKKTLLTLSELIEVAKKEFPGIPFEELSIDADGDTNYYPFVTLSHKKLSSET